jgi:hypothetical protein
MFEMSRACGYRCGDSEEDNESQVDDEEDPQDNSVVDA